MEKIGAFVTGRDGELLKKQFGVLRLQRWHIWWIIMKFGTADVKNNAKSDIVPYNNIVL